MDRKYEFCQAYCILCCSLSSYNVAPTAGSMWPAVKSAGKTAVELDATGGFPPICRHGRHPCTYAYSAGIA